MGQHRIAQILALIAALGGTISPSAGSALRLDIRRADSAFYLQWHVRSLESLNTSIARIVPDYTALQSSDLKAWEPVRTFTGGIDAGTTPVEFAIHTNSTRGFFRLHEQVNLPGADLRFVVLSNAPLVGADLSEADLSCAELRAADLRGANLQQAVLASTDLSYADLRGADIADALLTNVILLNTTMPDGTIRTDDFDAELLALELSGELLAQPNLYVRLRSDLQRIRFAFPVVADIHQWPRWRVGEVLASPSVQKLQAINASELAPAVQVRNILRFSRHYHPVVLSSVLRSRFAVFAEPNHIIGDGDRIQFEISTGEYTFSRGWGDCPVGCISRHYWVFSVSSKGIITLQREYGDPLPQ